MQPIYGRFMMKKGFLTLTAAGLGTALFLTACGHIGNITPDSKVKHGSK